VSEVDLREAVRKHPLDLPGVQSLTAEERENAKEHWRIHMAAEFSSARVFSGLVPQMMAAGLPYEEVREVTDMARQEVEHGLQSARVLAALGGVPVSALPPLDPVPGHAPCSPLEAVLRNVISISCCGETLAVAVIGSERERAAFEPLREILTGILADEVGHARFGWRLLRDAGPAMDGEMKRRLSAYLVAVFERDLRVMKQCSAGPEASFAALAVGASDGPLAWSTFLDTANEVTIPGLERHGLKARWAFEKAWGRAGLEGRAPAAASDPIGAAHGRRSEAAGAPARA
jgi:hypothetical protein